MRQLVPFTESDPVAILVEFLTAFGNLVGAGPHLWLGGKHPARLFICLVGETSLARKSGGWNVVRELLREVDSAWLAPQLGGGGLSSGLFGASSTTRFFTNPASIQSPSGVRAHSLIRYLALAHALASSSAASLFVPNT